MGKVLALTNSKGGVGKTTSAVNLGIGLAKEGQKVLLIDCDPQGNMSVSLGIEHPDELDVTLASIMRKIIDDEEVMAGEGILHHEEGVDFLPTNIELSALEVTLVNTISREVILKSYIDSVKDGYDGVIIDCMPSLGMMTINALAAADEVIIPVQAAYLPVKGLEQLISTISRVKKRLNRNLQIRGILLTMVDMRTNYARDISEMVSEVYGEKIGMFGSMIPMSVRAAEPSVDGISIYKHCPKGKAAEAYMDFTREVLANG